MSKDRTIEELRAHIASLEQTAALGYLLSAVVHEVNNPLSVMLIGADQLRHAGVHDAAVHRHLDALNQQSDRIITISLRLQELGRRNLVDRRNWDVRALLETFVELDVALEQPTTPVQLTLPDDPLLVEVNGAQMLQVLRYVGRAVRRLGGGEALSVTATQEEIPLIPVGSVSLRSPTRAFVVLGLRVGEPAGDAVPYREIVPDFFSEPRQDEDVELMASWELVRKLAGKMLIRSSSPEGAEIQVMIPLFPRPGDERP